MFSNCFVKWKYEPAGNDKKRNSFNHNASFLRPIHILLFIPHLEAHFVWSSVLHCHITISVIKPAWTCMYLAY